MPVVRVAAIQAAPVFLDLAATLKRLEDWTRRAAADGAKLVAFPESWLPGYPAWLDASPEAAMWGHGGAKDLYLRLLENSVEVPGPVTERIAALARDLGVVLVVGAHERSGRSLYNALLTFGPHGHLANHHRKLVPTYSERMVWGHGDSHGLRVAEAGGLRVGSLVCWEHWMPLARQALHDGGEQLHVAAWPWVHEMHQVASRHYAFEGRCFTVATGSILRLSDMPRELPVDGKYGADPDGLILSGGSAVIGPDGRYLAGPVLGEETIVVADCELDEIARESMTLDVSGHYGRPDVFTYGIRPAPPRSAGPET